MGVGAFITDAAGRLLLIKRRREPEAGCWGLAGGKVEFGETLAEACAREILEELGVVIAVGEMICVIDQIDLAAGTHGVGPAIGRGSPRATDQPRAGGGRSDRLVRAERVAVTADPGRPPGAGRGRLGRAAHADCVSQSKSMNNEK